MSNNTQKLQPFKKSLDVSRVSVPVFHELEEPEKKPLEEIIKIVRDGYLGIPLFQRDFCLDASGYRGAFWINPQRVLRRLASLLERQP